MARSSTSADAALNPSHRIIILHGPERFLRDWHSAALKKSLQETHGDFDLMRFDGQTAVAADVLDECRSLGLMASHKLVIVDNADQLLKAADDGESAPPPTRAPARGKGKARAPAARSNRDMFESYAQAPSEGATLLMRADSWRPGNLDKAIAKVGITIKCEPVKMEEAIAWVVKCAKHRHQVVFAKDAATLLVQNAGSDLARLSSEVDKLALVNPGQPVDAATVSRMVATTREDKFWTIQDAVLSGDAGTALTHLRDLTDVSRHDAVPLTWAIVELARKIQVIALAADQRQPLGPLMGSLKIWGPAGDRILAAGKRIGATGAANLFRAAVQTDMKQKSSDGDPVRNLELLLIRMVHAFA